MFSLAHSTLGGGGGKSGLVIIHGLLGQGRNWRSLQRSFVSRLPGFSVTTLDLRNHGDSPHCESMSIDELAEDVAGLIHDLAYQGGPQKWSVLGHSLGGKVAMHLALTRPDVVDRLVVADVAPVAYPVSVGEHANYIKAMLNLDLSSVSNLAEARALLPVQEHAVKEFLLTNLDFSGKTPRWKPALEFLLANLGHVRGTPFYGPQDVFAGNVLFVSGNESRYVLPEHHERIKQLFPKAQMHGIEGAGHWLHSDKPTEFMNVVVKFLQ